MNRLIVKQNQPNQPDAFSEVYKGLMKIRISEILLDKIRKFNSGETIPEDNRTALALEDLSYLFSLYKDYTHFFLEGLNISDDVNSYNLQNNRRVVYFYLKVTNLIKSEEVKLIAELIYKGDNLSSISLSSNSGDYSDVSI